MPVYAVLGGREQNPDFLPRKRRGRRSGHGLTRVYPGHAASACDGCRVSRLRRVLGPGNECELDRDRRAKRVRLSDDCHRGERK